MSKTRIRFENLSDDGSTVVSELEPLEVTREQAGMSHNWIFNLVLIMSMEAEERKAQNEKYDLKADVESVRSKADAE